MGPGLQVGAVVEKPHVDIAILLAGLTFPDVSI
jgi:hypothetical protein